MRKTIELQMKLGEVDISSIKFDIRSRDEIPKLLRGLQSIYDDIDTREEVFKVLPEIIPGNVDPKMGRNGMELWKILVLGVVRLGTNCDYDKLLELANEHDKIRQMLLHPEWDKYRYALQTLKDNVSLFTPAVLDKINVIIVKHGHKLVKRKAEEALFGSCDSFPVETNVHFPTDINILWDSMRKLITIIMVLYLDLGICGWRKGKDNLKKVKKLFREAQNAKKSKAKNPSIKAKQKQLIINAHIAYLDLAQLLVDRAKELLPQIPKENEYAYKKGLAILFYINHAERQIDQIRRRVIKGESIPHKEKVFSIFEEHTEWIAKGKAGVLVELGLNVCIVKDQFGFILFQHVMENETDDKVAVPIIQAVQNRFDNFNGCSFDKGFHSPANQDKLGSMLDKLVLPKKGKLSEKRKQIEHSEEFIKARRKHSAVESSINALENGGLDRCPDHGIHGFKRYVGLAVLARNLHNIGDILQKKEIERQKRRRGLASRITA